MLKTDEKSICGKKHKKFPQKPLILQGFLPKKISDKHRDVEFNPCVQPEIFLTGRCAKSLRTFRALAKEKKEKFYSKNQQELLLTCAL